MYAAVACPGTAQSGKCANIPLTPSADLTANFTLGSLRLDAIKPTSGPPAGDNEITLTGDGFGKPGDHVSVLLAIHCADGSIAHATAAGAIVLSARRIRALAPASTCAKLDATVPADVTVETYDASGNPTDSNPQTYTYKPEYVALGDSYSSGLGAGGYSLGRSCKRSPHAYGPLISARQNYSFTFNACAGATTSDVIGSQLGELNRMTTVVTITVGGNDVGFTHVLRTCSTGSRSECQHAINRASSVIAFQLSGLLNRTYRAIASRAKNAVVIVLGYPHLFTANGQTCFTTLTSAEEAELNHSADLLDNVIAARAAAHGFKFADPRGDFSAHEICSAAPWLNGLTLPLGESYHPNQAGQADFASLVQATLP